MKTSLLLKIGFILPLILFVDYLLMVVLGCATCLFGFGDNFYCGTYCIFGKILLGISGIFFFYLLFPDIKSIFKKHTNVETAKK